MIAFSLSDSLQSSKDATKRIKTWLLYSRREVNFTNLWVAEGHRGGSNVLPTWKCAVASHEAWPWPWSRSRCFQTKLKDNPGREYRTRQRHRALKPHGVPVRGQEESADMWQAEGVSYYRHWESLVKVLSRVLTGFCLPSSPLQSRNGFWYFKDLVNQAFVFSCKLISLALIYYCPFETGK